MTMHRARRFAVVAVVATLAVTGLSACRSAPNVAAYIGNDRITEKRVTDVLNGAQANQIPSAQGQQALPPVQRQDVVDTLVGLDVMRVIAGQRGVSPSQVDLNQVAQALGMKAGTEYVALYTEYRALLNALSIGVKPAQPTQADLRDVYDRLTAGGANLNGAPFAQFASGITPQDQQTLAQNIGLRNELKPQIDKLHTVVNPRYHAPELPLVSAQGTDGKELPLVVLTFAPAISAPPVTDVP